MCLCMSSNSSCFSVDKSNGVELFIKADIGHKRKQKGHTLIINNIYKVFMNQNMITTGNIQYKKLLLFLHFLVIIKH